MSSFLTVIGLFWIMRYKVWLATEVVTHGDIMRRYYGHACSSCKLPDRLPCPWLQVQQVGQRLHDKLCIPGSPSIRKKSTFVNLIPLSDPIPLANPIEQLCTPHMIRMQVWCFRFLRGENDVSLSLCVMAAREGYSCRYLSTALSLNGKKNNNGNLSGPC